MARRLFTSESVSMGHPDKMCDQISDAILDALLAQDPRSRVACETLTKTGFVVRGRRDHHRARGSSIEHLDRAQVVRDIGYTTSAWASTPRPAPCWSRSSQQSPDISQGVTEGEGLHKEQGAGDQGMMFGFACDETAELMPAADPPRAPADGAAPPHCRESGELDFLRPDAKSQVTVEYDDEHRPVRIDAVVLSTQHDAGRRLRQAAQGR